MSYKKGKALLSRKKKVEYFKPQKASIMEQIKGLKLLIMQTLLSNHQPFFDMYVDECVMSWLIAGQDKGSHNLMNE